MNLKYMDLAIEQAKNAVKNGEVPVGCVIVKNDEVIASAYNMKETYMCATKHAEIIAVEKASKVLNNWRLDGCDVYVTLEPCPMCASALKQARVNNIFCGLSNSDENNIKIVNEILKSDKNNISVNLVNNLSVEKVKLLLQAFFKNRRNS